MNHRHYYIYKQAAGTDKKYTQEEFDKLLEDYERSQRNIPDTEPLSTSTDTQDIARRRQEARRTDIDMANDGIVKARERSRGFRTGLSTLSTIGGYKLGGLVADLLGADIYNNPNKAPWFFPFKENYDPNKVDDVPYLTNAKRWYNNIVGYGSRALGAGAGWLISHLLMRALEKGGDSIENAYRRYSSK